MHQISNQKTRRNTRYGLLLVVVSFVAVGAVGAAGVSATEALGHTLDRIGEASCEFLDLLLDSSALESSITGYTPPESR